MAILALESRQITDKSWVNLPPHQYRSHGFQREVLITWIPDCPCAVNRSFTQMDSELRTDQNNMHTRIFFSGAQQCTDLGLGPPENLCAFGAT